VSDFNKIIKIGQQGARHGTTHIATRSGHYLITFRWVPGHPGGRSVLSRRRLGCPILLCPILLKSDNLGYLENSIFREHPTGHTFDLGISRVILQLLVKKLAIQIFLERVLFKNLTFFVRF